MSSDTRHRLRGLGPSVLCAVLGAGALTAALLAAPAAGWRAVLPMAVAVVAALALTCFPARVPLAATATAVAVTSALGTAAQVPPPAGTQPGPAGLLALVEAAALLVLVLLLARRAPARQAVVLGSVTGLLESTVVLRLQLPPTFLEAAAQSAFFGLGAIGAAAVGGYLRTLESRRLRAVRDARRTQRLQLARDLHDFVAHDVSGIVVLAQAAQVVGATQPERILPLLAQIEAAGLQALGSMDRTVHMLDGADAGSAGGRAGEGQPQAYGLADIVDVIDRFRAAGRAEVDLDIDLSPAHVARVPREAASTAHRAVVEALTNIRRHAPTTPLVRVRVLPDLSGPVPVLAVSVTNGPPSLQDGGQGERVRRGGGSGLAGLAERAAALGGTLDFGVRPDGGWRTSAALPIPE
ncbi:histidine kinase [Streptomyces sp. NBC_00536]|uniref:sensor histidine kinase n=1 Tax=Streptomyces sp. NBC_00536 TaxID=2975769 RepID=UPI002E81218D|nr:histidine kinase [Streptomyces sp. NBC_00536]WUC79110.1 histidine kinase [Streptomyces sp. NBC_00536]